jgi:hypothetical protein
MNTAPFSMVYFSTQPIRIAEAVAAGVDTAMVDCEYIGKVDRQAGADTQINHDTIDDLRRVRNAPRPALPAASTAFTTHLRERSGSHRRRRRRNLPADGSPLKRSE